MTLFLFSKFAKSGPLFEIFLELPLLTASWYDAKNKSHAPLRAQETVEG